MEQPNCVGTIEALEAIIKRPALYMGNCDNYFQSFVAFIHGYQMARPMSESARPDFPLDKAIPDDFHKFVTEHYGYEYPYGGFGWMSLIETKEKSDQERLGAFLKLRKLYEEKYSNDGMN